MYKTWDDRINLAKKYYEHYGNLRIKGSFKTIDGITYDENGFALGRWVNRQRAQYKNGELTLEHKQMLESIGMVFENINNLDWNKFYDQVCSYLDYHHTLFLPKDFKTINGIDFDENGKNLGAWWHFQRLNYNKGILSKERSEKIKLLYDNLKKYEELDWEKMYELAKKYYEKHNCLIIKQKLILIDDNGEEIDLSDLRIWIKKQRRNYKTGKLSQLKIKKLEKIGMLFENVSENEWERMYKLASIYFKENGNLKMSRTFKTKDGITYDKNGSALGKWLNAQYSNNITGTLPIERKQRLETIGMHFDNQSEKNWNEMLRLTIIYSNNYGTLDIPVSFRTNDGVTYNAEGKQLGMWLERQKTNGIKGTLTLEHRQKLEAIGFKFQLHHDREWGKMYELVTNFYGQYKHLDIPLDFKTIDGITYDENGRNLGAWFYKQQVSYNTKTLTDERKLKLEQLGMNNNNSQEYKWQKMYDLAQKYYLRYFNLKVRANFKTIDGVTYDENGENLGSWLSAQKTSYKMGKLSEMRIKKLELIGMVFEVSKNKQQNEVICMTYDIDYKKYKKQIDVIPYREFVAKINYLNENGIPFIIDGSLHPIFFMSSINMEVRYGLNLEQMINNYNKQTEKIKQNLKTIKVGV